MIGQSSNPVPEIAAEPAALDEIDLVEAPVVGGEMHAAAADATCVEERIDIARSLRGVVGVPAESLR